MSGGNGLGIPTGVIFDYSGDTAPAGWLICDGRAVSRTLYSRLFQVIGTKFGSGDGSTTFNLPGQQGNFRRGIQLEANQTFLPAAVNIGTDIINIPNHAIRFTGYRVRVSSTTTLPTGLAASTNYFVIVVDSNNIRLASTRANALAGTWIDITAVGSGTHSLLMWQDPDASTRQAQTVGGASGNSAGTFQENQIESHTHTIIKTGGALTDGIGAHPGSSNIIGSYTSSATGGNETRPQNSGFNWIIKI